MDGFLILDKPEGMTSAQCVYKLRSILGTKRIISCHPIKILGGGEGFDPVKKKRN